MSVGSIGRARGLQGGSVFEHGFAAAPAGSGNHGDTAPSVGASRGAGDGGASRGAGDDAAGSGRGQAKGRSLGQDGLGDRDDAFGGTLTLSAGEAAAGSTRAHGAQRSDTHGAERSDTHGAQRRDFVDAAPADTPADSGHSAAKVARVAQTSSNVGTASIDAGVMMIKLDVDGMSAGERLAQILDDAWYELTYEFQAVDGMVMIDIVKGRIGTVVRALRAAGDSVDFWERERVLDLPTPELSGDGGRADVSAAAPNDPQFAQQWGLSKIGVTGAWDFSRGEDVVVAVLDTGVNNVHLDLAPNMWRNEDEIAGNGRDDDGNGFVDDTWGWNFDGRNNNPFDNHGHGTHVAGIIAGEADNAVGISGVAPNAKIMAIKVLGDDGAGYLSDVALGIDYAVANGARIMNASLGAYGGSPVLEAALAASRAAGRLFVAAAGNDNLSEAGYPARYSQTNDSVISVAATDINDNYAWFSNHSSSQTSVQIAAPGVSIRSTYKGGNNVYVDLSGTSMAAPMVAGAAALVWAAHPTWTYAQVIEALLETADPIVSTSKRTATNGRLNVDAAIRYQFEAPVPNAAPEARNDSFTATAGQALTLTAGQLLSNDSDADGDTLSLVSVTQPSRGTLTQSGDTLRFQPAAGFVGSDSFSYTIRDSKGATDTATVTITVEPDRSNTAPEAQDDTVSAVAGRATTITSAMLLANDSDANGDTLTITTVTAPTKGTLVKAGTAWTYTATKSATGTDSFQYTVSDGRGGTDTATVTLQISQPPNTAPDARNDSFTTRSGQTLSIAAGDLLGNDVDADGDALVISGVTQPGRGQLVATSGGYTYTPNAGTSGSDSFTYTVSDGRGGTDTATVSITIQSQATGPNRAPIAEFDFLSTTRDTARVITAAQLLANDVDPDGDTLVVTRVLQPSSGSLTANPDGISWTYTPRAGYTGVTYLSYQITDNRGGVGQAFIIMDVLPGTPQNRVPVAGTDQFTTDENRPLTITAAQLLANDTDADGDLLSITAVGSPANGTLVSAGAGRWTYTPRTNFDGADSFTYTVSDGRGGTATGRVDLTVRDTTPVNRPPSAVRDSLTLDEDTSLVISAATLLANDSDPDGDTLTILSTTNPANGTLISSGSGLWTYRPQSGFSGADSFTYTVSDGRGGTATARVDLTVRDVVRNADPVAVDDRFDAVAGQTLTITRATLLANDTDSDGDTLSIIGVTAPTQGVLTPTASGWTYTSNATVSGTDSFTYSITDGKGGSDTGTVTLSVTVPVNRAPDAVDDSFSTTAGTALTIARTALLANDSDPDGDTLVVTGVGTPANGSVRQSGNSYVYTPKAGFTGRDSFTYTISDNRGGSDTATIAVEVSAVPNRAPDAVDDTVSTRIGRSITIPRSDLLANDSDPDGHALTIIATSSPTRGTLTSGSNGFTYTPNSIGTDRFTYTVSDGHGGTDTATVTINVQGNSSGSNRAPIAEFDWMSTGRTTPLTFTAAQLLANDYDPDGDPLQVTLVAAPTSGSIADNGNGSWTFTPGSSTGWVYAAYQIRDGRGGVGQATIIIDVQAQAAKLAPAALEDGDWLA